MTGGPCRECGHPLAPLGRVDVESPDDRLDVRTRRFASMAVDRGETGTWLVWHCTNPACRCDCRRYLPASSAAEAA